MSRRHPIAVVLIVASVLLGAPPAETRLPVESPGAGSIRATGQPAPSRSADPVSPAARELPSVAPPDPTATDRAVPAASLEPGPQPWEPAPGIFPPETPPSPAPSPADASRSRSRAAEPGAPKARVSRPPEPGGRPASQFPEGPAARGQTTTLRMPTAASEPAAPAPPAPEPTGRLPREDGPVTSVPAAPDAVAVSPDSSDQPTPSAPSAGWAATRLLGAVGVVGLLLAATLLACTRLLRRAGGPADSPRVRARGHWLPRWMASPPPDTDRIQVLARSHIGSRESISVIQVGRERFLVGITGTQVSLLARLEGAAPPILSLPGATSPAGGDAPSGAGEPAVSDFARALRTASVPADEGTERAIRTALARSRDRLRRLDRSVTLAGGRRE